MFRTRPNWLAPSLKTWNWTLWETQTQALWKSAITRARPLPSRSRMKISMSKTKRWTTRPWTASVCFAREMTPFAATLGMWETGITRSPSDATTVSRKLKCESKNIRVPRKITQEWMMPRCCVGTTRLGSKRSRGSRDWVRAATPLSAARTKMGTPFVCAASRLWSRNDNQMAKTLRVFWGPSLSAANAVRSKNQCISFKDKISVSYLNH